MNLDTIPHPAALHICLVCNTAWAIHTYRPGLIRGLLQNGIRVTVIAPYDATADAMTALGADYIDLPLASKSVNPFNDLRTLYALWRIYRKLQPDLIFHYTIKPNIYGSLAAMLARVKSIAVTTGLGYVFIRSSRSAKVAKLLYRLAFRFPREVWFLNPDDRETFLKQNLLAHPERAVLLPGEGIDLDQFRLSPLPAARQHFNFILIGRLLWDKGVGEYVAAARQLKRIYPHARFLLLGPAGIANPSAITRDELNLWIEEGCIEWLGETDDVRTYIADADCVVLPSYREGMPRTLLEASAMGRPIVASRVPGCQDVVVDGVTGLLCAARSADQLAAAMAQMLDMTLEQRTRMGLAGRDRMLAEFDERTVVARYFSTVKAQTGVVLSVRDRP
jgi:glycosyltransferase involved in cell wall biosynthesis